MFKRLILIPLLCLSLFPSQAKSTKQSNRVKSEKLTEQKIDTDWKLVWSDEFNYKGLPNKSKWDYEVGFIRNKEAQYYTKARSKNARVENGNLIIEGHKEPFKNPQFKSETDSNWQFNRKQAEYTSACLITYNKFKFEYGKVEIKAKLPQGQGVWPAFWFMGADRKVSSWPKCGEIDLMEYVNGTPTTIFSTMHWPNKQGNHTSKGGTTQCSTLSDWHTYTLIWDEKGTSFLFDNKEYFHWDNSAANGCVAPQFGKDGNPFKKPFYLLINFAIGGGWGGKIDPNIFPQQLVVDYVRIYKKRS